MKISKDLIAQHGLSDDEYKKVVEILGREPNLTELGIFSVMWSEHCSYKSSRVHLKKLPTTGPADRPRKPAKLRRDASRFWDESIATATHLSASDTALCVLALELVARQEQSTGRNHQQPKYAWAPTVPFRRDGIWRSHRRHRGLWERRLRLHARLGLLLDYDLEDTAS